MPKGVQSKVVHSLQFGSMYIDVNWCLHPIEPECGREFPQGLVAALIWQLLWGVCELVERCRILQTNVSNYSETFVPVYPISYCLRGRVILIRLLAKAKVSPSSSNSSGRIWRLHDRLLKGRWKVFFRRLNWKEREDGCLPISGAEVKNDWCRCLHSPIFVNLLAPELFF